MNSKNILIELSGLQQEEIKSATNISVKSVVLGLDRDTKEVVFKGFVTESSKDKGDGYLKKAILRQPAMVHEDDGD